jgi:hypothetical protein
MYYERKNSNFSFYFLLFVTKRNMDRLDCITGLITTLYEPK